MYSSSVLEHVDTFFLTWWSQFNDRAVSSHDLLPIASKDSGFQVRYQELNELGKRARLGAFLHNLSKSGRVVGPYQVQKERQSLYRLLREAEDLPLDPPVENPFGWLPSPKEFPVLGLMGKMQSLGCSSEAIAKALNMDQHLCRGKVWTASLVEKTLAFTHEGEDFVFRSEGSGPRVEANNPDVSHFYLETAQLGRVVLRYNKPRKLPTLACEKDGWVWRPVLRDGRIEGLSLPAALRFWVCGCLQVTKETSPEELAGVLDGLARIILQKR